MPKPSTTISGDYADEWKIVDSLEKKGLFKSALEKVETIQTRAQTDNNQPQVIKALLFRGKYTAQLEEDGFVKAIQLLEKEEKTAKQPEKSLLQSMLGQLYATYLQQQGWSIGDRTPVPDGEGGDIMTWSAAQIEKHALDLFSASIVEETLLSSIATQSFGDVVSAGNNDTIANAALRPTLYDLLAHRAVDHFMNERSYLTEPAFAFQLDQEKAFADWDIFQDQSFASEDKTSGKWLAINLFQKLIRHHSLKSAGDQSAQKARLYDLDLKRLQFVYNNSVREDKNTLYHKALETLHRQAQSHPAQSEIAFQLASFLYYQNEEDKPAKAKAAVALCEEAVRLHPDTRGAQQCRQLLAQIRSRSLSITVEEVSLPNQNSLVRLSFRNLSKAYVKVVKVPSDDKNLSGQRWEERVQYLLKFPEIQRREWTIPDPADYQEHSTELALDGLPLGHYWVLVSDNDAFGGLNGHVAIAQFTVSQLAVVHINENQTPGFVSMDRLSGVALAGVKLEFFQQYYGGNKMELRLHTTAESNKNGFAEPSLDYNVYTVVRASYQKDTLWIGSANRYEQYDNGKPVLQVQFFMDRKLYRPGQLIYFKGVAFKTAKDNTPQIVPNQSVTVKLFDVNEQEKGSLKLRTNEFGSFNGVFTAPASGLTGMMNIKCEDAQGAEYFNVEEYKRPRFEVKMKPVEGAYRVGDRITVKGEAKNYAGNVVDGAVVRYRVVRQARFPFWDWGWFRKPYRPVSEMEITNGIAATDVNGAFEIPFEAIPDRSIPKKDQPVFDYQVMVDVTDISGETRSTSTQVSAGYVALQVDWSLTERMELDSLKHVILRVTNMSGQAQDAEGRISLQRLTEPPVFYKNRFWERPDVVTIGVDDWVRMFPDIARTEEDNPEKWNKEGAPITVAFNTATKKTVDLHSGNVQSGYYLIQLFTKDKFGENIEIKKIVRISEAQKPATRFEKPVVEIEKGTLEPGETARFWLGGKPAGLNIFFARESEGVLVAPTWVQTNGAEKIDIPVKETDRGGFSVHWFSVYNNRVYGLSSISVIVPWSNKDLQISYETFRDKLSPGQKEEWRIKISGPKKDKVAAEMVAAMYDASLDQFMPHEWQRIGFPYHYSNLSMSAGTFNSKTGEVHHSGTDAYPVDARIYPGIEWWGFPLWGGRVPGLYSSRAQPMMAMDAMQRNESAAAPAGGKVKKADMDTVLTFDPETYEEKVMIVRNDLNEEGAEEPSPTKDPAPAPPALRRNLNETVFFFPELRTDKDGNIVLKFVMNEALTRWKLLTFAHTKTLQQVLSVKEVVTQKELMVIANAPRFLRAGDSFEFAAKVSNLSQETIKGGAVLNLLDATTLKPIDADFGLAGAGKNMGFEIKPGQSAPLAWKVKVPEDFAGAVTWQIFADGNKFKDGEESSLPVVSNRMLVTETLPITLRGNQNKSFVFDNFKNGGNSNSLVTHRYTIEFTSNPVWYAVQALPYLMEYPHECSEQMFSRFYANTLASSVVEKMPQIKRVYDRWKGTDAMKSNLSKNQELKSALLEETPWVLDAQNEAQQKQNIALLFDLNRMSDERTRTLGILAERQMENGAWAWFPGGQDSWYITQHIVTGFGHLGKLGAFDAKKDQNTAEMLDKALGYCDRKLQEQYRELERLVQEGKAKWEDDHLDGMTIQYLYARSFFTVDRPGREVAYYLGQAEKYWLGKGLYQEGLLALALHRNGRGAAMNIVASLRERATMKEELGMYWPVDWGFYWYQLPVETQALMVEVFSEVSNDSKSVEELRIWLLKNKQTNRWESTKATSEAVYALLIGTGAAQNNWLNNTRPVEVSLGGKTLKPAETEAGTGYFKQEWTGKDVKPSWSKIDVKNPNSNIVWGAAYWQYFEDLDKIKNFQKTPLTIVKQLFTEENSPTGPVLKPIVDGTVLHRGDKVKVRIEIRVDRAMEFVHLKDMRAAGFEPVNVLSGYRWQDRLGYYESTKDLATNFFIDYLPRGTFVFEYPLVVSHRGEMSNGITTMQCMYAPEFTSHSKGVRVTVE
ncbi:MAG: hypothetical protein IT262_20010 [Saprospiraceae bacterium]|nr:hypothetical protein [Saprospiraceae bacterium]